MSLGKFVSCDIKRGECKERPVMKPTDFQDNTPVWEVLCIFVALLVKLLGPMTGQKTERREFQAETKERWS